jgi:hypothetical protein
MRVEVMAIIATKVIPMTVPFRLLGENGILFLEIYYVKLYNYSK